MSQESSASDSSNIDNTAFFVGTPSKDEIKRYFMRQKRLLDLKRLEIQDTDPESSPDLSESFELYLKQRKQKIEDEKEKIYRQARGDESPVSTSKYSFHDETVAVPQDDSISEESFLAMEKACEKTLHLNNESVQFMDLTSMHSTSRKSDNLDSIEAPSFLMSSQFMNSPSTLHKGSPVMKCFQRPSTILEVSEYSNRTGMSSYKTAMTGSGTEASYQTAADESSTLQNETFADSLDDSSSKIPTLIDLTKDSLDEDSGMNCEPEFNDTLERMEYMLAQSEAMKENPTEVQDVKHEKQSLLDFSIVQDTNLTKSTVNSEKSLLDLSIVQDAKAMKPLTPTFKYGNRLEVTRNSPMIKFSPGTSKQSPSNHRSPALFKKPVQAPGKTLSPFNAYSNRYCHIQSPIAAYIHDASSVPLAKSAGKVIKGITHQSKTPNFRDSDIYYKEKENKPQAEIQPRTQFPHVLRYKKTPSNVKDHERTPGGDQVKDIFNVQTPEVKMHKGQHHHMTPKNFGNIADRLNETQLSDMSFSNLSLVPDDSIQIVDSARRVK